ncbi:MAG: UMP kinase, partial [Elusimicrobiota bacterium]
ILKATRVDGVYSSDPEKDPDAKLLRKVSFKQAINRKLAIMDTAALSLLQENGLGVIVFNFLKKGNLKEVAMGGSCGTRIG